MIKWRFLLPQTLILLHSAGQLTQTSWKFKLYKEKWNKCRQTHTVNICVQVCTLYAHFKDGSDRNNSGHTVNRGYFPFELEEEAPSGCWNSEVDAECRALWWVGRRRYTAWYGGVSFILFWWRRETVMKHPLDDSWMTGVQWLFTTGRETIFRKPMTGSVKKKNRWWWGESPNTKFLTYHEKQNGDYFFYISSHIRSPPFGVSVHTLQSTVFTYSPLSLSLSFLFLPVCGRLMAVLLL